MIAKVKKPVFREIPGVQVGKRNLVVGIYPTGWITVRLKGTRQEAEADLRWLYRNRTGIALHMHKLARRRQRKEAAIAYQCDLAIQALEDSRRGKK